MSNRADEIRRRIARRKREKQYRTSRPKSQVPYFFEDEGMPGTPSFSAYEGNPSEPGHPLFRKELFLFKIMLSAILVLAIGILFKNPAEKLEPARSFVQSTMESDFKFAAISDWYEKQFGEPLALLPSDSKEKSGGNEESQYAMPAAGRVLEDFKSNGQGVMVETTGGTEVNAMSDGFVKYAGKKDDIGQTVIIEHADGSESWYGHLDKISVPVYELIEKGDKVGNVKAEAEGKKGTFYFAIKKGDNFIDPIQVISFE